MKQGGKMGAGGAQVHGTSEKGELTNPPVLSSLHPSNIDAKYVFIFSKYNYYFGYYMVGDYYFAIIYLFCY